MRTFDVVIIGAGSVGVPLSFFLAEKSIKVGVIDKMPSVGRGQNRSAIGGIRATHSDPAKIRICQISIDVIKNMKEKYGRDVDWVQGGYLFPVYDEAAEIALKDLLKFQKKFNLNIDWVPPNVVDDLVPGINKNELRGGTFSPDDGSASPLKVADAFYTLARNEGAEFIFNEKVISVVSKNESIESVVTDKCEYAAGMVVDSSGAAAGEIGKIIGMNIPVYPDSHEAGITEPVQRFFEPMVVDIRPDEKSANYYFYQNAEGQVVFCITPSPIIPGKDIDSTSEFLPLVVRRMVNLYPRLRNLRVRRTWRGLYPMTPDGFPIVGYVKKISNFILAAGMCGQGFMLGPGLGKILSEIIVDKTDKYDHILEQLTLYRSFMGEEVLK